MAQDNAALVDQLLEQLQVLDDQIETEANNWQVAILTMRKNLRGLKKRMED